jgi:hypothetical protein
MVRTWTDDETTLIATDSMQINTGINTSNPNRTGDLNLTGAAILSDNMDLNVKGDINKTDLQDTYYSESMGFGLQVSLPVGGGGEEGREATKTASTNNSSDSQSPAQGSPSGSTTISGSYSQEEAKRTTYATIGGLDSKLVSETKTMIGADFEGELTIDHRLLSEEGRKEIGEDFEKTGKIINKGAKKTLDKIDDIQVEGFKDAFTPATHSDEMSRAFINADNEGGQEALKEYKDMHDLSDEEVKLVQQHLTGEITPKQVKDGLDEKSWNSLFVEVHIGTDGTDNNMERDLKIDDKDHPISTETNVVRIHNDIYGDTEDDKQNKKYIIGVGTKNILDKPCLVFGCGGKARIGEAVDHIQAVAAANPNKLILIDMSGFSRGSAEATDLSYRINNKGITGVSPQAFDTRSLMLFDTVASFGKPGNETDLNYNLSTNYNPTMTVIQATAGGEIRKNFPLSSIAYSDGTLPPNHYQKEFDGSHSDGGGSYPDKKDISFHALNWVVDSARNAGVPMKEVPAKYQPSATYLNDYNNLRNLENQAAINPNNANTAGQLNNARNTFNDNYAHKSHSDGTPKFWNWSNPNGREIYYPNDATR